MPWLAIGLGLALVLSLAALAYWLLMEAELAYLGPGPVRRLYDWGARDYDRIKRYDRLEEFSFLGRPLLDRLEQTAGPAALVLDLGTGTGRLPLALLDIPFFEGTVLGLDLSPRMLAAAAAKSESLAGRYPLLLGPAYPLPFADASFDAVSLLELLELLPDRDAALAEALRVLRPGGYLLLSNRRGLHARLMPGRTDAAEALYARLTRLGAVRVRILPWQEWYDLVWARKRGRLGRREDSRPWTAFLRCPACGSAGDWRPRPGAATTADPGPEALSCRACGGGWRRQDGIWRAA